MKYVLYLFALFFLLIIQTGIMSQLGLFEIGNLLLIFTAVAVILSDTTDGLTIALMAGVMMDFASGTRDGTLIISFLSVFAFTYLYINKFVPREPNRIILYICIAINTFLFALTFVLVNKFLAIIRLDTVADWHFILGRKLLLDLLANVVLAYPVYIFFVQIQKIQRRLSLAKL